MPYRYSAELRVRICQRMLAGEEVAALASELHISPGTLHRWKKQALIDNDLLPGVKSYDSDELELVKLPRPCSMERCRSAQKEVPGCSIPERPGLHRTRFVSGRGP